MMSKFLLSLNKTVSQQKVDKKLKPEARVKCLTIPSQRKRFKPSKIEQKFEVKADLEPKVVDKPVILIKENPTPPVKKLD